MKRMLSLALMCALLLVACTSEEAKVDENAPPPPPEPTADEIAQKLRGALQPLYGEIDASGGAFVSVETKEQAKAQLRSAMSEYTGKQHLPEAQKSVASEVGTRMDQSLTAEAWPAAQALAESLQMLDPANPKAQRALEKATREMNRPRVSIASFFEDRTNGVQVVFLRVMFPELGVTEEYPVREGEEFAEGTMRLEKIIGRRQGVKIRYTDDGKQVEIMRQR
jgi:hypothetical protein